MYLKMLSILKKLSTLNTNFEKADGLGIWWHYARIWDMVKIHNFYGQNICSVLPSELFCHFCKELSICHVFCTKLNTFTLNVPPSSKQRPFMEFFSRPFASSRSTALTGSQLWWIAHLFLKIAKDGVLCTGQYRQTSI